MNEIVSILLEGDGGTEAPRQLGGESSVITTLESKYGAGGPSDVYGHPHAKPDDVMGRLVGTCPEGVIADPFTGSGSTLIAARKQRRKAIGVEVDERYLEAALYRLNQGELFD